MKRTCIALAALALLTVGTTRGAPRSSPWGEKYFPNVPLVTHDGVTVKFYDDLIRDKHVVVSFIYTHCKKQCGLMTANLARVQRELGDRVGKDIFFYSISLEPEADTPEVLKKYREAFKAGPGWTFLTGKPQDIVTLRHKFGDYASIEDHAAHIHIGNDSVGQWWATSVLDNPKYLATVIGDWMDPHWNGSGQKRSYAEAPGIAASRPGQTIFRQKCVMCHLPEGQSVGPDLQGVVARRGRPWIARWLKAPEKLVAGKDPVAVELLARYKDILMPNLELTDTEIEELLNFLDRQPPTKRPATSASSPPTTSTAQMAHRGRNTGACCAAEGDRAGGPGAGAAGTSTGAAGGE